MVTLPFPFRQRLILALLAIAIVLTLAGLFTPEGAAQGGAFRLVGRFHPLVVHFPIVLLLLIPLLEWAGRRRPGLHDAAGCLLGLAVPSAVVAVAAGLALARADGHEGPLLQAHFRGGVLLALGTALTWLFRGHLRVGYVVSLVATLGLLGWAAHNGGSLTHGGDYLTESLPASVKRTLGVREPPLPEIYPPDTVFAAAVRPILEQHCFSCHGAEKQKGDYRMDAFATLLAGGKSGQPAIVPGDLLHSELLRRLPLEADDAKLMPPRKQPRLPAADIALLRWWVKQGAPLDLTLTAAAASVALPPEIARRLVAGSASSGAASTDRYVPRVGDYTALATEIRRLESSLGVRLVPVSQRPGDGLILRPQAADHFGDAELTQLAVVAPFIVEAELAGTRLTDAGLSALQAFTHLERLHLERTALSGTTLHRLRALPALEYLNLCFTAVSDATLDQLHGSTSLKQLYLFGSQVTPTGSTQLRASLPLCHFGPLADPAPPDEGASR